MAQKCSQPNEYPYPAPGLSGLVSPHDSKARGRPGNKLNRSGMSDAISVQKHHTNEDEAMSQQENLETQKKMGEAVNKGRLEAFREIFATNVVDHDPAPDQGKGPEGFIQFFTAFRSAFPDLEVAVDHMVSDEDNVSIAYRITGTHKGNFLGIPATGKKVKARGVQIARFENGKIIERWGSSDELGILKQIGAVNGTDSIAQVPAITGQEV